MAGRICITLVGSWRNFSPVYGALFNSTVIYHRVGLAVRDVNCVNIPFITVRGW